MNGESDPSPKSRGSRDRGSLCIVLHSHMPYVEGFGTWPFGEEWLLEAIASVYLPLISCLERAAERGDAEIATVGVTPVLADQLALSEVGDRFLRFMRETRAECHRLDTQGLEQAGQREAAAALRLSAIDYEDAANQFESYDRDLLGALRRLESDGVIELWASAATHAVLPLLATEAGVRLQVSAGIEAHRLRFASWGGGFWLPECAFSDGIDTQLSAAGVQAFCVDQTTGGDALDQLEPTATGGAVAVPIDWRTVTLVWDDRGYPSHPLYRDYHAHTTNGLRPWANSGRPYDRDAATRQARGHARDFVGHVIDRLAAYQSERGRPGLVVCALDTELLGHWWYEGPTWLEAVIEQAREVRLDQVTLRQALERHEPRRRKLRRSSWGVGKDLRTWDSPVAADLVWSARRAELSLTAALASRQRPVASFERAARELLALQSSDWAFMASRDLAADYPWRRVAGHVSNFERALAAGGGGVDSRAMPTPIAPALRGLAPWLRLDPLLEPVSSRGRDGSHPLLDER
jgi:1,4-alpha-glucan branching enzyme